ncbi:MAG: hypothetical protein ACF8AM_07525, partial [Rhodopirellula sp. JB055]
MKRIVTHLALAAATAILATGCVPVRHNLPPEQRMMQPGPGVGGPGPGVLGPQAYGMMGANAPAAATGTEGMITEGAVDGGLSELPSSIAKAGQSNPEIQQVGFRQLAGGDCGNGGNGGCLGGGSNIPPGGGVAMMPPPGMMPAMVSTAQVTFGNPDGMQVRYDQSGAGMFDSEPLVVPARQNFPQGGLYRLKLTNIPSRPGVELYPTVELAYANPRTGAYLAHNSVPIQFTEEDFDQVLTGNFVT